jgi:predicted site-specific integrase-resolvase
MNKRDNYYTVAEASDVLGKSIPTIYKWMSTAKLHAEKNPVTGQYMILKDEADELASSLREWA